MDFAKFVQDYLNQKTEGDPSFMVSEESLAFVDLMRKDDMDRRASAVREQTNPNERGEQDQISVTEEANNQPSSDTGDAADPSTAVFEESQQEVITSPAVPVSEVALGTDPLQATISDNDPAEPAEVFQESGNTPQSAIEQNPPPEANAASPHQVFTEGGQQAATNEQLRQEGAQVTEIPNLSGETTVIAPEGMPEFDQMLKRFDSDYRPPSNPIGDDLEFPEIDEQPPSEELQNTTELAESMMTEFSDSLEQFERRAS
jgi:chemotaxis protein histidine kinase CheA